MALCLKFMSAVVRKADVDAHYPGGCLAFESEHLVSSEDDALYALISMSGDGIENLLDQLRAGGFDTDRFVAVADMWAGPFKHVAGIAFFVSDEDFPPLWFAHAVAVQSCLKRDF